ncbi:MAG: hypothetical protein IT236_14970 [Bacteroidia bacterium]|nr:hypothetical protein [Bacteroidia bacterium]
MEALNWNTKHLDELKKYLDEANCLNSDTTLKLEVIMPRIAELIFESSCLINRLTYDKGSDISRNNLISAQELRQRADELKNFNNVHPDSWWPLLTDSLANFNIETRAVLEHFES